MELFSALLERAKCCSWYLRHTFPWIHLGIDPFPRQAVAMELSIKVPRLFPPKSGHMTSAQPISFSSLGICILGARYKDRKWPKQKQAASVWSEEAALASVFSLFSFSFCYMSYSHSLPIIFFNLNQPKSIPVQSLQPCHSSSSPRHLLHLII